MFRLSGPASVRERQRDDCRPRNPLMPKENAMTQASSAGESRHSPPQESPNPRKTGSAGAPASPIEHVVIIVKENHIFDNYFGTFPGAAGATEPHAADPETSDPPIEYATQS